MDLHVLTYAAARATDYRRKLTDVPVFPSDLDINGIRRALANWPAEPTPALRVLQDLVEAVEPALVACAGPRYFGFVTGGALAAATGADVLTTGWDQNAFNALSSPAAALVEEAAGDRLKELLGLPVGASFGFVTGAQGANTAGIAAGRHRVLANVGWDVARKGLWAAPRIRVVANAERHGTIDRALGVLGFGTDALEPVATGAQGAIDVNDLARALEREPVGPTIVCLQAGNVNTGACDDLTAATALAHDRGAWVHVDGAFGLWAAASPVLSHLVAGVEAADSWSTDGHKWLNVPYDSGYVFCADPEAHFTAMSYTAPYLTGGGPALRSPGDYVLESSRRARGFATWAALRQLGRDGAGQMVEQCCALARRFAELLTALPGISVANDVVLNQVLVRFGDDDRTDRVIAAVQRSRECWMGATTWHGLRFMRISVSNALTTEADVDRSVDAIRAADASVTG